MGLFNIFSKKEPKTDLERGLNKTKEGVFAKLARAVAGKSKVDDEVLDELEEVLISSDVGVDTTVRIIRRIEERVARDKYMNTSELQNILRDEITALLEERGETDAGFDTAKRNGYPFVVMVVGVNGVGKTTTIGKLAAIPQSWEKSIYRCRGHIPGCCDRTTRSMGRTCRSNSGQTKHGIRPGIGSIRHPQISCCQ